MLYTGQFKNINEILYQLDIITSIGTGTTEILFTNSPFTVDVNKGSTIYEPLKLSNATCTLLDSNYHFDLYSSTAQGTKVTLTNVDAGTVEWVGYLTPNIYTQGFEQEFESIELECIDGLSTLENIMYSTIDPNQIKIYSFQTILLSIIKKCNCYNNIYINANNNLLTGTTANILKEIFMNEQNFFSEDGEAMTSKEVLTEMFKYLGNTLMAVGDSLFILDYDYIKNGYSNYYKLSTTNNWVSLTESTVSIPVDSRIISSTDFKSNGGKIELDNTYNQISISTSLYKKDSLLPDFFDEKLLTNHWLTREWNSIDQEWDSDTVYLFKYFFHQNYSNSGYTNTETWTPVNLNTEPYNPLIEPTTGGTLDYNYTSNYAGAAIMQMTSYPITNYGGTVPNSLTWNNYILLHRHDFWGGYGNRKVLFTKTLPQTSFLFDNYYIVIDGSMLHDNRLGKMYIDEDYVNNTKSLAFGDFEDLHFDESDLYQLAKLKIGNKYWGGILTGWTTTETTFKIQFAKGNEKRGINNWFRVYNTIEYTSGIDAIGQKIPINASDNLIGDVYFELQTPNTMINNSKSESVWLKDFSVKLVKPSTNKDDTTDTLYKNVINDNFVNDFSELNLKICSQTDKGMSYSSVIQKGSQDSIYKYNSKIYNKSLNLYQKQEYNLIERYVNQYSEPRKCFVLTLNNNINPYTVFTVPNYSDDCIVDSMSIDYFNGSNEVRIIEKV